MDSRAVLVAAGDARTATGATSTPPRTSGVLTGLSGLTVVDVDDPELVDNMSRQNQSNGFGSDTPNASRKTMTTSP